MAAALVIALQAAVIVVPQALADGSAAAHASGAVIAQAATSAQATAADQATVSDAAPFVSPFVIPTPPPTPVPTPTRTPKPTAKPKPVYRDTVANARIYIKNRIGLTQYNCIDVLFQHESKWNPRAMFPSSGDPTTASYGIPQAHPGIKMAAFGSNWRTSPLTQVKWGIWYVNERYGSACAAEAFKKKYGWY
jgi:hypothetical protein